MRINKWQVRLDALGMDPSGLQHKTGNFHLKLFFFRFFSFRSRSLAKKSRIGEIREMTNSTNWKKNFYSIFQRN